MLQVLPQDQNIRILVGNSDTLFERHSGRFLQHIHCKTERSHQRSCPLHKVVVSPMRTSNSILLDNLNRLMLEQQSRCRQHMASKQYELRWNRFRRHTAQEQLLDLRTDAHQDKEGMLIDQTMSDMYQKHNHCKRYLVPQNIFQVDK